MPTYRQITSTPSHRTAIVALNSVSATQIIAWTLFSSYIMSQASAQDISSRKRTAYYMINGLANLYILELLGSADFSSLP